MNYAASVFACIPAPSVFDFNVMMIGFLGDFEHGKAVSVYGRMCRESVKPMPALSLHWSGHALAFLAWSSSLWRDEVRHDCDVYV
ncbi:uncharacterized protein J3R85_003969 [Psidium guajava]|nr:uncharacterized protein J3R85_003969 [Psidium guajava]